MNKLDLDYQNLLQDILENGVKKGDRTGTGTISVFGRQIRHKMSEGFPLLTTKKMHWHSIVTELIWFLKGETNIKYLVDNDCHIWDGDCYKSYFNKTKNLTLETLYVPFQQTHLYGTVSGPISESKFRPYTKEEFINKIKTDDEFAKKWGDLGPIYGKQWRNWTGYERNTNVDGVYNEYSIDQIGILINDLKTNPDSRRLMVNAWNPAELTDMVLPPCHYGFQLYTSELSIDERIMMAGDDINLFKNVELEDKLDNYLNIPKRKISLMWNQRSVDTFLGLPFNIASYGLLLEIIAKEVNMVPDELIGNLGDTHLYLNHIEQAKEQIGRKFTEEEIIQHLQESGMDALIPDKRLEYVAKLPKTTRQPYPLPNLKVMSHLSGFESWLVDKTYGVVLRPKDLILENYQSHPAIKALLSN